MTCIDLETVTRLWTRRLGEKGVCLCDLCVLASVYIQKCMCILDECVDVCIAGVTAGPPLSVKEEGPKL